MAVGPPADDDDDVADPFVDGGWTPGPGEHEPAAPLTPDLSGSFTHPDRLTAGPESTADPQRSARARRRHLIPWGRMAERWVPEPLRDSRIDPGRRGAVVLALVAVTAAVVTAFGVWRDRPEPQPINPVALQAPDASTGASGRTLAQVSRPGAAGSATAPVSSAAELVVAVTGRVRRPGLVRLKDGARVADALAAAGGAMPDAQTSGLNLAARVTDGQAVVVPGPGESVPVGPSPVLAPPGASVGATAGVTVNLNTADAAALDALPGVGPVTAANIVAWRTKNGMFNSVEQLQEIPGIGPAKFAQLAPMVTLG